MALQHTSADRLPSRSNTGNYVTITSPAVRDVARLFQPAVPTERCHPQHAHHSARLLLRTQRLQARGRDQEAGAGRARGHQSGARRRIRTAHGGAPTRTACRQSNAVQRARARNGWLGDSAARRGGGRGGGVTMHADVSLFSLSLSLAFHISWAGHHTRKAPCARAKEQAGTRRRHDNNAARQCLRTTLHAHRATGRKGGHTRAGASGKQQG